MFIICSISLLSWRFLKLLCYLLLPLSPTPSFCCIFNLFHFTIWWYNIKWLSFKFIPYFSCIMSRHKRFYNLEKVSGLFSTVITLFFFFVRPVSIYTCSIIPHEENCHHLLLKMLRIEGLLDLNGLKLPFKCSM